MPDTRPVKPLGLDDASYDTVLAAARPLAPDRRDIFMEEVATLVRQTGISGGELYRHVRELQRKHWDPPHENGLMHSSKYSR